MICTLVESDVSSWAFADLPNWEHLPLFLRPPLSHSLPLFLFFSSSLFHLPFTTPSYSRPVLFPAGIDLSSIILI